MEGSNSGVIVVKRDQGADPPGWYFVVEGNNGEPIATSETYTRQSDALRGAGDLCDALEQPSVVVNSEGADESR